MKILPVFVFFAFILEFAHSSAHVNVTCTSCESGCSYQHCFRVLGNKLDVKSCYRCTPDVHFQLRLLNCQYDLYGNKCSTGACYLPVDNICYSHQQSCPSSWVSVTCQQNCRTSSCSRCFVTQTPTNTVINCVDSCDGTPNFNATLVPCTQDFKGSSCTCCTKLSANAGICTNNLPYLNNNEITQWTRENHEFYEASSLILFILCFMIIHL